MFGRVVFMLACVLMFLPVAVSGQRASTTPKPEPSKINARPTETPQIVSEPFDKADIKMMAAKCIRLETEAGEIEFELYPESAPETVRNFLNLASTGAFDTTTFSRIVPGFVIQGGNISTRESGYTNELALRARRTIPDEPNKILHERGIVSMARPDEPNKASTHFFILVDSAASLDGKYAAFGRVTKGMSIVDAINKAPVEGEKPVKPVRIKKVLVVNCTQLTKAL
ncbi:MAG: peptidylprolyl isomerase [Chloracidobacterium sp.]|nr:peptidylprolyl isomerase [Chloracidobacterium sp.]